ncbi:TSUP family transporter [Planomicrobium sp. CPCC 101079]|uniref:sulfite exporter TauE/SafE family protein n=1 Tax=Planomicrobium sp. CPCC 101079 TaxID=2599618 RepID=UPI0011B733F8|nr:TSUP family transporter [Planomicrobium sp. CPCC 101079]TWT09232.1 TSUP family transporter [Planomicrobium sp. CPCC 101079]
MEYLLLFFIGVVATTIGTLAGGGGLVSLPAMLFLGMPIHSAIGANKVSNAVSSFSSFFTLYRRKQLTLKECSWIVPFSLGGGITGGLIAAQLSPENLYIIAITLMAFAFITSFISKGNPAGAEPLKLTPVSGTGLFGIGIYDGLFGPGQGTLMLYLFSYLKVAYVKSVGLVRFATFSSCFGAAISYILSGAVIWPMTLALMAGSVTGAQLGVRIAEKLNPIYVKPILRIVTALVIVQLIADNVM